MANVFSENVEDTDFQSRVVAPVPGGGAAETLDVLLQAGLELRDKSLKAGAMGELTDIDQQEAAYQKEESELTSKLVAEQDKSKVNALHSKLISLRAGEEAGKLSSREGAARRAVLVKQAFNETPWLASEIRSMVSAFGGTSGTSTGGKTGTDKGIAAIEQLAVELGTDFATAREFMVSTALSKRADEDYNLKVKAGNATFPDVSQKSFSNIASVKNTIYSKWNQMLKENPQGLDEEDMTQDIRDAEESLYAQNRSMRANLAKNKIFLTEDQIASLDKDVANQMAHLTAVAKERDKGAAIKKQVEYLKNLGTEQLFKFSPLVGTLTAFGKGDYAMELAFQKIPEAIEKMKAHGGPGGYQTLAALGDQDAIIMTKLLEFDAGFAAQSGLEAIAAGKAPNTVFNRLIAGTVLNSHKSIDEGTSSEQIASLNNAAALLLDPETPVRELEHFLQSGTIATVNKSPEMKRQLSNRLDLARMGNLRTIRDSLFVDVVQVERDGRKVTGKKKVPSVTGTIEYDGSKDQFVAVPAKAGPERGPKFMGPIMQEVNLMYKLRKTYGLFEGGQGAWIDKFLDAANTDTRQPTKEEEND